MQENTTIVTSIQDPLFKEDKHNVYRGNYTLMKVILQVKRGGGGELHVDESHTSSKERGGGNYTLMKVILQVKRGGGGATRSTGTISQ